MSASEDGPHGEIKDLTDYLTPPAGHDFAFVSHDGALIDLNTLAPPAETGWTLQAAEAVNDAGQIAAVGTNRVGEQHYLLLNP